MLQASKYVGCPVSSVRWHLSQPRLATWTTTKGHLQVLVTHLIESCYRRHLGSGQFWLRAFVMPGVCFTVPRPPSFSRGLVIIGIWSSLYRSSGVTQELTKARLPLASSALLHVAAPSCRSGSDKREVEALLPEYME